MKSDLVYEFFHSLTAEKIVLKHLLYKHQWNTKLAFPRKLNMLSSHVKRSPSLWLYNKSRLWKQADLVFHWCLYNKQNITYSFMDMNFIFSCSTRYLTSERSERVRYRVDHSRAYRVGYRVDHARAYRVGYRVDHARACNILYLLSIGEKNVS